MKKSSINILFISGVLFTGSSFANEKYDLKCTLDGSEQMTVSHVSDMVYIAFLAPGDDPDEGGSVIKLDIPSGEVKQAVKYNDGKITFFGIRGESSDAESTVVISYCQDMKLFPRNKEAKHVYADVMTFSSHIFTPPKDNKMEKSTERKSNVIKNAIVAWKEKYNPKDNKGKILMIVGTIFFFICVIRIIALVLSSGADGLPNCNDHKLINEKLPRLVKNRLDKEGYDTLGASIIFSKAEESYYDGKTGVRRCTAVMTIKKGSKIELIDMEYQIAWINKETGEYQYRILD